MLLGPLLIALTASAALAGDAPEPAGHAPLRYRDVVFAHVREARGVVYRRARRGDALTLDIYRPAGDRQTSRPAIVFVHGGGFTSGTAQNPPVVRMATS